MEATKNNNNNNFTIDDEETNPVLEDEYDIKTDIVMTNSLFNRTRAAMSMIDFKKVIFYAITILLAFAIGSYSTSSSSSSTNRSGSGNNNDVVLITGATGRTGSKLYHELKHHRSDGVKDVRAFVRDVDKARDVLGCKKCDESEGIYVGDVTNLDDLQRVITSDITTLAIAVGASPSMSKEMQRSVEFNSVLNSIKALGNSHGNSLEGLKVVLCSTIGTATTPAPEWSGDIEFWKLNAEAFLPTSGISTSVIVKPCGLVDAAGHNATLVVGHNDEFMKDRSHITIAREDVARVMAEAVITTDVTNQHYRFDLCSRFDDDSKSPTTNKELNGLLQSSKWDFNQN